MQRPRAKEELLSVIADALPAVLAYIDNDERYQFANRFYAERYGRPPDLIGLTAREVLGEVNYGKLQPYIRRALSGQTAVFEVEVERGALPPLWVTATYVPDRAPDGTVLGFCVFSEDITEQRKTELQLAHTVAELRGAHETLDAVVRASPTGIMLLDLDATVHMWNPAAERIFGFSAGEVLGRQLPTIDDADRAELAARLARVARGEVLDGEETRALRREGVFDVTWWAAPVRHGGADVRCLSIVVDATARRRADKARRFLNEAGRALTASLDYNETRNRAARIALPAYGDWCLLDVLDDAGEFVERMIVGADAPDLRSSSTERRFPAADLNLEALPRSTLLSSPVEDHQLQALAVSSQDLDDLRRLGLRSMIRAPLMVRGKILGAMTLGVSQRTLDEQDVWVVEELARSVATAIDSARLFAAESRARDRIGRMQQVTAALSRARTAQEVAEVTCRIGAEAMEAAAGAIWLQDAANTLTLAGSWGAPKAFMEQYRTLAPDDPTMPAGSVLRTDTPLWVETEDDYRRVSPELFERNKVVGRISAYGAVPLSLDGRPRGVMVFAHPVNHRYDDDQRSFYLALATHCAQALERARLLDESRAANRVKDEFLAMLGHELRNPLAPILTALQLMELQTSGSFLRERRVIERQVRHLARLVDDLLDVSRIASGRVQLELETLDVADVLSRALEIAAPLIEERRHQLDVVTPPGLFISGDPTRLAQVFANLLSNAAKYTPEGGQIAVQAGADGDQVTIVVRDSGTGITRELLPHVFELFTQGPQAPHRPQGGLGLGLAIVRSLVTLHGGTVAAESEGPGAGARFVVSLPLTAPPPSRRAGVPSSRPGARAEGTILIVDDNVDAAELLGLALNDAGYTTLVAHDGPSALARCEIQTPDLAVLDLGLPVMDGYELARKLRIAVPNSVLVALTGYGQPSDRARTKEAGFSAHLVKPLDLELLLQLISDLLAARASV